MARNPWQRLTRQVAYENPWLTVWHDEVIQPDGAPGIYGVVHFANRAIGVLAIDDSDRVLLVGQYRYPLGAYSWEIPEGGGGPNESALDAARRELVEETGFQAGTWRELGRAALFKLRHGRARHLLRRDRPPWRHGFPRGDRGAADPVGALR